MVQEEMQKLGYKKFIYYFLFFQFDFSLFIFLMYVFVFSVFSITVEDGSIGKANKNKNESKINFH